MNIREMHYDIERKLNKLDSQQNRKIRVPEKDTVLNEAIDIYIKSIAQPRVSRHLGFEISQRSIDDIRTIVVDSLPLTPIREDNKTFYVELPEDYAFYITSNTVLSKDGCGERVAKAYVQKHKSLHEESVLNQSSFEWREVNIRFYEKGIKIFTDGTFDIVTFYIDYIRKHKYVHNAQDFLPTRKYQALNGLLLEGSQDCELPEHTHREIVDIAVFLLAGELQLPDYQIKQAKLAINQIT